MEEVPSREEIITLLSEYCRATPTEEEERYVFEIGMGRRSEAEALRLCVAKFVDLNELKEKLNAYDDTLIKFYRSNKVDFSGGVEVDFESAEVDQVHKALTKRIYSTRNALVHSKDGEKSKYTPFKDDRSLVKEVSLMRFISEMVFLEESTVQ